MKGIKVLVVEDEQKIAEIVKAYLEKEQYQVFLSKTVDEALTAFKQGFDLIKLDLMLHDMEGE